MNTFTLLIMLLIGVYTFYIYKQNILLKSEMSMLKGFIDKQTIQNKELMSIYKSHNTANDLFVETIGFDAKAALEHRKKRIELEQQEQVATVREGFDEMKIGNVITIDKKDDTFEVPTLDNDIQHAPSEYDSLFV